MTGESARRFVRVSLWLLATSFFAVGLLFLFVPETVNRELASLGDGLGTFSEAPETGLRLWLALSFAYMTVIAGICLIAQADPVRYRPLLLLLAVAKAASSLAALGFYLFTDEVFVYLLNFIVDGGLVAVALGLWALAGRIEAPERPG